jgi:hypothetical protein
VTPTINQLLLQKLQVRREYLMGLLKEAAGKAHVRECYFINTLLLERTHGVWGKLARSLQKSKITMGFVFAAATMRAASSAAFVAAGAREFYS